MSPIEKFLSEISEPQKTELEKLHKIIISTVPEAEQGISYGMPSYKYKGKYLIGFSVFKNHMSLFPTSAPINALKSKLNNFKLSKGTIQFTVDNPIPESLVRKLICYQIDNIDRVADNNSANS